jgi:hypothetical protein
VLGDAGDNAESEVEFSTNWSEFRTQFCWVLTKSRLKLSLVEGRFSFEWLNLNFIQNIRLANWNHPIRKV